MGKTRVGIIGYGHLGKFLHEQLLQVEQVQVVRLWNRTADPTNNILPLDSLDDRQLEDVDLVVEVAHPAVVDRYAALILQHADLFIGSPTCLANQGLFDTVSGLAEKGQRRVFVPAGAFWGGPDIQKMARLGQLKALRVTMKKHPNSFKLNPPLLEVNEQAKGRTEATVLYEGRVRELCAIAPNNVNTMAGAAVAACNLGFDGVQATLIADPALTDWHIVEVHVVGPDGFEVSTERRNPAKPGAVTGQLTYFSFLSSIKEALHKPSGLHIC